MGLPREKQRSRIAHKGNCQRLISVGTNNRWTAATSLQAEILHFL